MKLNWLWRLTSRHQQSRVIISDHGRLWRRHQRCLQGCEDRAPAGRVQEAAGAADDARVRRPRHVRLGQRAASAGGERGAAGGAAARAGRGGGEVGHAVHGVPGRGAGGAAAAVRARVHVSGLLQQVTSLRCQD